MRWSIAVRWMAWRRRHHARRREHVRIGRQGRLWAGQGRRRGTSCALETPGRSRSRRLRYGSRRSRCRPMRESRRCWPSKPGRWRLRRASHWASCSSTRWVQPRGLSVWRRRSSWLHLRPAVWHAVQRGCLKSHWPMGISFRIRRAEDCRRCRGGTCLNLLPSTSRAGLMGSAKGPGLAGDALGIAVATVVLAAPAAAADDGPG